MSFPLPEPTPLSQPYWDALKGGKLTFQRCRKCRHAWLPPRAECPNCLAAEWDWTEASGTGRVISWVIYHHAYHPEFKDRLPYNVALVELDEGPRLITNIVRLGNRPLQIDQPVKLCIETEHGMALARFELV
jgi:uncharacterized OB-fold protein